MLPAGDVLLMFDFVGGDCPTITRVDLSAGHLRLVVSSSDLPRLEVLVDGVVHGLQSFEVDANAVPEGQLVVRFGFGLQLGIAETREVRARGAAEMNGLELRLSRPLEITCDGDGIVVGHRRFDVINRLARVRIAKATLHPDGLVELDGGASRPLNRAVRGGLRQTSRHLSDFVRRSPALGRFLS